MKSARKVSAKQHYLSVARYVVGQSTNLPSRYRPFPSLLKRILIGNLTLVFGYFIVCSLFPKEDIHKQLVSQIDHWLIVFHLKKPSFTQQLLKNYDPNETNIFQIIKQVPCIDNFTVIFQEKFFMILHHFMNISEIFQDILRAFNNSKNIQEDIQLICNNHLDFAFICLNYLQIIFLELVNLIWDILVFICLLIFQILCIVSGVLLQYIFLMTRIIYRIITDADVRFQMTRMLIKYPCQSSWGKLLGISQFCEQYLGKYVKNSWRDILEIYMLKIIEYGEMIINDIIIKWSPVIFDLFYSILWRKEKLTWFKIMFSMIFCTILKWLFYL